jgi:uncharacterized protein
MKKPWYIAASSVILLSSRLLFAQTVTEGTPYYSAPSKLIQPGGKAPGTPSEPAPGMKVQLISDKGGNQGSQKEYAVIFSTGDEAFAGLNEFAQKYNITSAHFTAIGAVSAATVAWLNVDRKEYKVMPFTGQMEILSMVGDIAVYQGKPVVHTHAVLGLPDGTTRGGHVVQLLVRPTLEVMVTVDPKGLQKRLDPETGMTLISPAADQ